MKRVLLISYYFPPLGGAGVARPLSLFKHLSAYGWECDVLTVKNVAYRLYEPELLDGLDTSRIYRAGSTDPQRILYLLGMRQVKDRTIEKGREISNRFFPDAKVSWVRPAVKLGRTLASNRKYDALISTSPPISSHLVGMQLAKECRIPWIADFRDFWHAYPAEELFTGAQLEKAKGLLSQIKSSAAELTTVNESIRTYMQAGTSIHNSVDSSLIPLWQEPINRQQFTIGILGTLSDLYPIEPLLQLIAAFRETQPGLGKQIRLIHVGAVSASWLLPQLQKYGLEEITTLYGIKERKETIRLLSEAALFYIGLPSEKEKGFSTGRIFTLLSSGRPILALVSPDGEIAQLIRQSAAGGHLFSLSHMNDAITYLVTAIQQQQTGALPQPMPIEKRLAYSSEKMTEQFAAVLNRISR